MMLRIPVSDTGCQPRLKEGREVCTGTDRLLCRSLHSSFTNQHVLVANQDWVFVLTGRWVAATSWRTVHALAAMVRQHMLYIKLSQLSFEFDLCEGS